MNDKKAQGIEPELIRELADILRATDLSEIEVEHGELKLRLARTMTAAPTYAPAQPAPTLHVPALAAPVAAAAAPAAPADARSNPGAVPSPMVGTAYLSPEPGAAAFIKVGDTVTEGQTVLIIEAMKTFNPIPAPRAGKIVQILVTDGQPVEFGEPLLILE
jgi:acetyl-CoA carboxylase biotin carboxyl carrier protein